MMTKPIWWDYATFDEEGDLNGIEEDAPKEIQEAYKEYLKEKTKRKGKGIKV